ncbi:beta-ketoacyl synthase N-terminal-like domain-containing protein [Streptomyces sp. NPDC101118]|uniref:beta-ketoacyl synthase N-terminal-like domain-containing protein n=1 Tax=Streptomyces sp. NPDC101118 TaxID=3366109 RepID=UPI00382A2D55
MTATEPAAPSPVPAAGHAPVPAGAPAGTPAGPPPADPAALVVSGWAVASPYGLGRSEFSTGLRAAQGALTELDPAEWPVPYDRAGLIPGFDIREVLGRKGTRAMDRVTAIAAATVGMLLADYGQGLDDPEGTGLVLGTSGSVQSIMDFTESALTGEKPFHVDPARFPNTVMNCPAGASAIRHTLKGPNVTLSGGATTGLLTLNYASRLLRAGHASALLAGAVEEFSPQRARLERVADHGGDAPQPLGEGAALFMLERAGHAHAGGRVPLATVLGLRFRSFADPARAGAALERCVADVLAAAGAHPEELALVAPGQPAGPLAKQEAAVLDALPGPVLRLGPRLLIGDTTAAAGAFQTAAVLAESDANPALAGRLALVTAVDRDGTAGAGLLRLGV